MRLFYVYLLAVALVTLVGGCAVAPSDQSKQQRITQYLDDIGVVETLELRFDALRNTYATTFEGLPPCFWEDDRVLKWFDDYKSALLQSYIEVVDTEFTDEELNFLVDFYASRKGRRAIELGERTAPAFVTANAAVDVSFSNSFIELIQEVSR